MRTGLLACCGVLALMVEAVAAQDARSVLQAAAKEMGAINLRSIQYSGTGWKGESLEGGVRSYSGEL